MHPGTYKKRSERNKIARPVSIYRNSCERNKRTENHPEEKEIDAKEYSPFLLSPSKKPLF